MLKRAADWVKTKLHRGKERERAWVEPTTPLIPTVPVSKNLTPQQAKALRRRRAKNKVARASRKRNRHA